MMYDNPNNDQRLHRTDIAEGTVYMQSLFSSLLFVFRKTSNLLLSQSLSEVS